MTEEGVKRVARERGRTVILVKGLAGEAGRDRRHDRLDQVL